MGKIVVTTNVSLDGIVQDPDGKEGYQHGGWFGQFGGKDLEPWAKVETDEALQCDALLLGRKSDEWFASRWLGRTGAWADRLNSVPKYVVSSTLKTAKWSNVTVIKDPVEEVPTLKRVIRGDILIYASYALMRTLIEHALVDEFRLVVFPVVLGTGVRLFGESSTKTPLRLARTQSIGEGLLLLTHQVVR